MPWRNVWEPPTTDSSLSVLKELPDGVSEDSFMSSLHRREASGLVGETWENYHWCPDCKGWVPGTYNEERVNTLDTGHLAGRQGTEYYCRRCGYQVDFDGIIS